MSNRQSLLVFLVFLFTWLSRPPAVAAAVDWLREDAPTRGTPITALATDLPGERLAVADLHGVALAVLAPGDTRGPEAPPRFDRVARVEGVLDLAFARDGALWIAATSGLWQLGADGRLREHAPQPGSRGNGVRRVVAREGWVAVATASGVSVAFEGGEWHRTLGARPIVAVALGGGAARPVLWAAADTDVWRIELDSARGPTSVVRVNGIPGRKAGEAPVDLRAGWTDTDVVVLYAHMLASLAPARRTPGPGAARPVSPRWTVSRPLLPPGAVARRLASGQGRYWIVHDRGVSVADRLHGPWHREPASTAASVALVASRGALWLATAEGLLRGVFHAHATREPPARADEGFVSPDPRILAVQRAALRYLGLGTERIARMRRGVRWRGWLPTLSLDFAMDDTSDWTRDHDQAFISGGKRFLVDHDSSGGRDYEGRASLSWDLSDGAFDPEAVDLLREERQVVALRDDVLDEIHQIYFERQRLLRELASAASPAGAQVADKRLRAAELAAGLDGWTGGWFSTASRATGVPRPAIYGQK